MKCHVTIQLSTKVCHIFTKKNTYPFFLLFHFVTHCLIFHFFPLVPPLVASVWINESVKGFVFFFLLCSQILYGLLLDLLFKLIMWRGCWMWWCRCRRWRCRWWCRWWIWWVFGRWWWVRVADPVWYCPDPDSTSCNKPDPDRGMCNMRRMFDCLAPGKGEGGGVEWEMCGGK